MPPNQQSAHVKVGLVLTQVRGEFLRASTSDPEGPARAAKALSRGFELLNCCACCYLCRSCDDSDTGEHCEDCVGKKEDQLLGASSPSVGERSCCCFRSLLCAPCGAGSCSAAPVLDT